MTKEEEFQLNDEYELFENDYRKNICCCLSLLQTHYRDNEGQYPLSENCTQPWLQTEKMKWMIKKSDTILLVQHHYVIFIEGQRIRNGPHGVGYEE